MPRLAALLSLLAIAVAQVPLLTCASDCQDAIFSAAIGHECHVAGEHRELEGFHYHGCVGHTHRHRCSDDAGEGQDEGPDDGDHELIQVSLLSAGARLELPAASLDLRAPALLTLLAPATPLASKASTLEAAHRSELDPVPVPPPASVRLLL